MLAAKAALRQEVWAALTAAGVARFPGAAGRIQLHRGGGRGGSGWRVPGPVADLKDRVVGRNPAQLSFRGVGLTPPKNTPTSAFHRRR